MARRVDMLSSRFYVIFLLLFITLSSQKLSRKLNNHANVSNGLDVKQLPTRISRSSRRHTCEQQMPSSYLIWMVITLWSFPLMMNFATHILSLIWVLVTKWFVLVHEMSIDWLRPSSIKSSYFSLVGIIAHKSMYYHWMRPTWILIFPTLCLQCLVLALTGQEYWACLFIKQGDDYDCWLQC